MFHAPRRLSPLMQAAALSLASLTMAVPTLVQAEAAAIKTQVPGYYRQLLGSFEITALYDGEIKLDTKILKNVTSAQIQKRLAHDFRTNPTATAVNAFLVNTGSKLILVDAGAAKVFGPTLGQVLGNLKAAGYDPAQVDAVLITHLHGDHVGGLLGPDGLPAFPKATVYVDKAEAAYWLSPEQAAKAPDAMKGFFKAAQDATAPYVKAGLFKTFEGGGELFPGVKPIDQHGHTPGHSGYLFESGASKLLIWGDVIHNASVQFPDPKVTIEFDNDQKQAMLARLKLFGWTTRDSVLVGGAHLAFPGLGHIRREGKGEYTWVPVDYAPVTP